MAAEEMEVRQLQVDVLQAMLQEVKNCVRESGEDAKSETEVLWERLRTAATLMTNLKTKARVMAVPDLGCGIRTVERFDPIDKNGILMSWSMDVDLSSFKSSDETALIGTSRSHGSLSEEDGAYLGELLNSVQMIIGVMEGLVKRSVLAEYESEVEKVSLDQEENRQKAIQIQTMSTKLQEVERVAVGANGILSDMRQQVVYLVEEASRQKQRAVETEVELCQCMREYDSLKSQVDAFISAKDEILISSQKQVHTLEMLFERCKKQVQTLEMLFESLGEKASQLESEKLQKEAEVSKLVQENVQLTALVDQKEALLLAMNEQFKVMAIDLHF